MKVFFNILALSGFLVFVFFLYGKDGNKVFLRGEMNQQAAAPISIGVPTSISAKVVRVIDGDTIDVSQNGKIVKVRLLGINAPETVGQNKSGECFGPEASERLRAVLNGGEVRLETDPSQDLRDKYGRFLAYVFLPNDANVGELMIEKGFAREYTYTRPYEFQKEFKKAEASARGARRGLWSVCQ